MVVMRLFGAHFSCFLVLTHLSGAHAVLRIWFSRAHVFLVLIVLLKRLSGACAAQALWCAFFRLSGAHWASRAHAVVWLSCCSVVRIFHVFWCSRICLVLMLLQIWLSGTHLFH